MSDNPISQSLISNPFHNAFIMNAYLRSHYADFPYNKVEYPLYEQESKRQAKQLLAQSLVMMTHLEGEPDIYLSFIIYAYEMDQLILHYAYTKNEFRRQGLVKETIELLLPNPQSQIVITQYPKSEKIMNNFQQLFPHSVFDPFYFTRPHNV